MENDFRSSMGTDLILCESSVLNPNDLISSLRKLYKYNLFHYIEYTYTYTRSYEAALALSEYLIAEIDNRKDEITSEEYERWDKDFIFFKLRMLNYSDRWKDLIDYYEEVKTTKTYNYPALTLSESIAGLEDYVIRTDNDFYYLHFLHIWHERYEKIKTKYRKLCQGKKVGNLMHKPQSDLSDDEINNRLAYIGRLLRLEMRRIQRLESQK